ncbi:hypothetical protein LZD49_19585 [Dyadobacter sp. CY261]|uniref:glycosyltransferase domain-containing protein n=1 Tax=Dyadobacter sp. CY261 TaxID=2907203 RepID=UPI001F188ADB|nr:glycosyltransferase domain-containing protein [Dyadobacter sp. CY261]MCF0072692.1 hypothetical protein [Dyadobacter sp. CY261]
MKIVTCISDEHDIGYRNAFRASCNRNRIDLITIVHNGLWDSHRAKDFHLRNAIEDLPGDEIVLFSDGYDVIVTGGEEEIMRRYMRLTPDRSVVVSAERTCYPDSTLEPQYPSGNTPYRFLNSGGIIGSVSNLLTALRDIEQIRSSLLGDEFEFSNQYLWTKLFLEGMNSKIVLDTKCELFQTFPTTMRTVDQFLFHSNDIEKKSIVLSEMNIILQDFDFAESAIFNRLTGTYPLHLHFNGPVMKSAMLMSPFISLVN